MPPARLLGKPVFIRELPPQDLKLEIEHLSCEEAIAVAAFLVHVVGRAHARQLEAVDRANWVAELQRNRSASLHAPSWLWNSVVGSRQCTRVLTCSIGPLTMLEIDIAAGRLMTILPDIRVRRTGYVALLPRHLDDGGILKSFVDWLAAEGQSRTSVGSPCL